MAEDIVMQAPEGAPGLLFLLFHGVGSEPRAMAGLGRRLGAAFPASAVVCVAAPHVSDLGTGRQWFSVQGVTEGNRAERVGAALPSFIGAVRGLQADFGVAAAQTALVGFSQGAIMALAGIQSCASEALAGRVVSLAGRLVGEAGLFSAETVLHLVHGERDSVISPECSVRAGEGFSRVGGDVTVDVLPGVGHSVSPDIEEVVLERLLGYVPRRVWAAALSGE